MYEIKFAGKVPKQVKNLPVAMRERVLTAFTQLQENPLSHGSEKLAGNPITYRIRVGTYRILYSVNHSEKILTILEVDHRKDIYRKRK